MAYMASKFTHTISTGASRGPVGYDTGVCTCHRCGRVCKGRRGLAVHTRGCQKRAAANVESVEGGNGSVCVGGDPNCVTMTNTRPAVGTMSQSVGGCGVARPCAASTSGAAVGASLQSPGGSGVDRLCAASTGHVISEGPSVLLRHCTEIPFVNGSDNAGQVGSVVGDGGVWAGVSSQSGPETFGPAWVGNAKVTRNYACNLCTGTFVSQRGLSLHKRRAHAATYHSDLASMMGNSGRRTGNKRRWTQRREGPVGT